ncbi:MAG: hypothetical protein AB3N33_03180 [Puniceicoccaceae bacterium]
MEDKFRATVRQHLAVILGRESGDLAASLKALDTLKSDARGHLAHYLAKRSYQKAWVLLEGGDPEKGVCS